MNGSATKSPQIAIPRARRGRSTGPSGWTPQRRPPRAGFFVPESGRGKCRKRQSRPRTKAAGPDGWRSGQAARIAEATGARTAQEEHRHAFDANFPQVQPKRREQREQNRPSARLKGRNWHTGARGGDSIGGCKGRQASQTSVCAAKVFAAGSVRANRRARRAAPLSARNRSAP